MGWKSTMYITEADAKKVILSKILEANSDQLGDMLDALFVESSYNFMVVDHYEDDDQNYVEGKL